VWQSFGAVSRNEQTRFLQAPGRAYPSAAAGLIMLGVVSCVPRERAGDHEKGAAPAKPVAVATPVAAPPEAEGAGAPPSEAVAAEPGAATAPAAAEPARTADPLLGAPFSDDFERGGAAGGAQLGPDWRVTNGAWRIADGRLCGENARNHPVWLARRLPVNARIEFDALSESEDGDLKAEYWGDGTSSAAGQSYTDATSYLTIFGGWKNTFHVLARRDEHAPNRREIKLVPGGADLKTSKVVPHRVYRFRVERRDGRTVRWQVDDMDILTYRDDEPLSGPGHEHFGFNDWQVRVCFDNLRVTPLQD
jgi:hypothetical protein